MIRALKALVDWIDKRYPPKVTITAEKFAELEDRLFRTSQDAKGFNADFIILAERVGTLEDNITSLKKQKEESKTVATPERVRSRFIETGRLE